MTAKEAMKVVETAARQISRAFLKYLHIGTWLDQRTMSLSSSRAVQIFTSVEPFWQRVSEKDLSAGDRVRFKGAFLTEWVPRSPGGIWSVKGLLDSFRKGGDVNTCSIGSLTPSPTGVVRLPFGSSTEEYAVLSLTTGDSWCCDLGIPCLVSASVYDSFLRSRVKQNAVEGEMEALLCFGNVSLLNPQLLSTIGSDLSREILASIVKKRLPIVYLKVVSPLDVKFRSHNTHPPGNLWCIYRSFMRREVPTWVPRTDGLIGPTMEFRLSAPYVQYGFQTKNVQVSDKDAVKACVRTFKKHNPNNDGGSETPPSSNHVQTVRTDILTEFDARRKYFRFSVPLVDSAWTDYRALGQIKRTLTDLQALAREQTPNS